MLVGGSLVLSGCSTTEPTPRPNSNGPQTISVPAMASSIQEAVDAARPGDTIEISPGTYNESVVVRGDDIVLRGTDRNSVVLDGGDVKSNGVVVTGDHVRVENLTVKNYTINGVLVTGMATEEGGLARGSDGYQRLDPDRFPPVDGFAVRYVSAYNNGLYGVYAFDAQNGILEHNYASGSADSGLYVGQCSACNVLVRNNVAESNAVGYEQTNASNTVTVINNRFTGNRLGMTLLSDYQEAFIPLRTSVVAGNFIGQSNNPDTPAHGEGGYGLGIGVSGATDVKILKNRITDNPLAGIEITSTEDLAPTGIHVRENVFENNHLDLAYTASTRSPGSGNCLDDASLSTSPKNLAELWDCNSGSSAAAGELLPAPEVPRGISYRKIAPGPAQPTAPQDDSFTWDSITEPSLDALEVPGTDLFEDLVRKGGN